MWSIPIYFILAILIIYLAAATFYLLGLALAYFLMRERIPGPDEPFNYFAILVPAHNEELLIVTLCQSLLQVDYPKDKLEIFIIADNCSDRTADICRQYPLRVLERHDPEHGGKGQALAWALQQVALERFDAVFMVDADNYVDLDILRELSRLLNQGEQAIQCYNAVGNREDSWFTQLLFVSRTISNLLYHEAKFRLGLSSYLMGNGLCFRSDLLQKKGWTAFSAGEDWEYYAQLVDDGIKIGFASKAKVFHQESRSLNQATSQRLRWSSGKFRIGKTLGLRLLEKGLKEKDWFVIDASLPLIFPNYSLQFNLTLLALGLSKLIPSSVLMLQTIFVSLSIALLTGQIILFAVGVWIAGSPWKIFKSMLYIPLFLFWKLIIDLLSIFGIYRGEKWVRTKRYKPEVKGN
jgi:cellulose synthase/poly-beta-1,6-N-acetylglucosamine synthase-like glycosyltransferase